MVSCLVMQIGYIRDAYLVLNKEDGWQDWMADYVSSNKDSTGQLIINCAKEGPDGVEFFFHTTDPASAVAALRTGKAQ